MSLLCFGLARPEILQVFALLQAKKLNSSDPYLTRSDLVHCIGVVRDSQQESRFMTRQRSSELPSWDDVIGLDEVKLFLHEHVISPIKFNSYCKVSQVSRCILFTGPANSGFKIVSQAVANAIGAEFFTLKFPLFQTQCS
ncbi:hypothetical protein GEMRC1_003142 [Eukaryota sp. GEM-RC1]